MVRVGCQIGGLEAPSGGVFVLDASAELAIALQFVSQRVRGPDPPV